jgi:hypothetical protein
MYTYIHQSQEHSLSVPGCKKSRFERSNQTKMIGSNVFTQRTLGTEIIILVSRYFLRHCVSVKNGAEMASADIRHEQFLLCLSSQLCWLRPNDLLWNPSMRFAIQCVRPSVKRNNTDLWKHSFLSLSFFSCPLIVYSVKWLIVHHGSFLVKLNTLNMAFH